MRDVYGGEVDSPQKLHIGTQGATTTPKNKEIHVMSDAAIPCIPITLPRSQKGSIAPSSEILLYAAHIQPQFQRQIRIPRSHRSRDPPNKRQRHYILEAIVHTKLSQKRLVKKGWTLFLLGPSTCLLRSETPPYVWLDVDKVDGNDVDCKIKNSATLAGARELSNLKVFITLS
ncbi:hypothetical protein Tco_0363614 [Tanacetum coccineum]